MSQVATAPVWTTSSLSQYSLKPLPLRVSYPPSPEPERDHRDLRDHRDYRYYEYDRSMPPPPIPTKRKYEGEEPARSSRSPESDEDSEYNPRSRGAASSKSKRPPPPSATKTPAGKVTTGPNGRPMSREALRKANHSLIERRRREKINFALGELREMVPGLGGDGPGGKGGEFKLEVLERTVVHMRELKAQVAELERAMRSRTTSHSASHSMASTNNAARTPHDTLECSSAVVPRASCPAYHLASELSVPSELSWEWEWEWEVPFVLPPNFEPEDLRSLATSSIVQAELPPPSFPIS
ncbi:hypothetical protein A1Q2_03598 [Trichosporon asahii var. asahii CBS 8904]|uniref:BHLH domain-containing protein n=1 Tax=Trichosporon asahii var. asahii (strain CBS 8904) TaxID=1220162 RepID=K1VN71_TRIAC|nr:hypothetical protein A1Q2_03598 [Trichosporon asahii var. asahii CBS 8904]